MSCFTISFDESHKDSNRIHLISSILFYINPFNFREWLKNIRQNTYH